ncbi:hypothetical protein ACWCQS_29855 [Streptomyces sp. NPDC002076]
MQALYQLSYSPLFYCFARFPRRRRKHYRAGSAAQNRFQLHTDAWPMSAFVARIELTPALFPVFLLVTGVLTHL